jgi:hypothetical protein
MADIQAQAELNAPPPVVDPDASLAALPDAASSPSPIQPEPTAPESVDLAGMDGNAYQDMVDQMRSLPPVETEEPTPEPSEVPQADAPNEPAAEETTQPETEPEPATTEEEDEAAKVANRIRLKGTDTDKALVNAANILVGAKGITFDEAWNRVNGRQAEAKAPEVEPEPALQVAAPEAIQSEIDALRAERKNAAESADTVRMAEIEDEIDAAKDRLAESRAAKATALQQANRAVLTSKETAQQFYPAIKDPNSALSRKWDEIHDRLKALNDPLLDRPDAPLRITQMAAAEEGIAPANPKAGAPAPKASPSVPPTPTPKRPLVQPAPGSARSSVPTNQTGQLEAKLAGINSLEDYEAFTAQLSGH